MPYHVEIQTLTPQPIAVVRRTAKVADLSRVVPEACGEVWNFVRRENIAAGRHVAVYHDDAIHCDIGVELTGGLEVNGPFTGDGTVHYSTLPEGDAATTAHFGPYHLLSGAHEAIHQWCNACGLTMIRPCWEVYGHWTNDPTQIRTDVYYSLARKS